MHTFYGANPVTPLDYDGCMYFIDAFKQARGFQRLTGDQAPFYDRLPQPGEDCKQVVFVDGSLGFNGEYKLYYKGKMTIGLTGGSPADLLPVIPFGDRWIQPIRVRAEKDGQAQLHLTYKSIEQLEEMFIARPGYSIGDRGSVFTKEALDYVKSNSISHLRSMSWLKTNSSPVVKYEDFTEETDLFWRGEDKLDSEPDRGSPFTAFLYYCHLTGTDPWVNIPHMADDTCIHRMATETLTSVGDSKAWVYLELSNEHWNTQSSFQQSSWFANRTDPRFSSDVNVRRSQSYAKETARVIRIWRAVFGSEADRIRPIVAGHYNNSAVLREAMKWMGEFERDIRQYLYGLAVTGYFGDKAKTVQELQVAATTRWVGQQADKFFATCRDENLAACVYEGGLSGGEDGADSAAKLALHHDPAIVPHVEAGIEDFRAAARRASVVPGPFTYFTMAQPNKAKTMYGMSDWTTHSGLPKVTAFRNVSSRHEAPVYESNPLAKEIARLVAENKRLDEALTKQVQKLVKVRDNLYKIGELSLESIKVINGEQS